MSPTARPADIVDKVSAFFAEHKFASLRLPSGWVGRPHDNLHGLTETRTDGEAVMVCLDDEQVLTLDAERAFMHNRVLEVAIRSGHWRWTEFGGDNEYDEVLGHGTVEFHAPFHD